MLKYVSGSLEWVAFVVVPLVGILLLFAVPWLDRKEARSPAKRPISMIVFAVIVVGIVAMTYLGATAQTPAVTAPSGTPPPTPASALETTPNPGVSVASHTIGSAEHGQVLFVAYCQQCHGVDGKNGITNPNSADGTVPAINPIDPEISGADKLGHIPDVQKFVDQMDVFLQNGSSPDATPDGADPMYKMPSFGNTFAMSQPQIADVEAYVVQLNGAQRVALAHPDAPKTYAWWTLGGFFVVAVVGGIALVGGRKRRR
jgi:mono/diheme cytochrome c family protein